MFLVLLCSILGAVITAEADVLDPALYLLPSPPLVSSPDSLSPGERWKMSEATRVTREADTPDNTIDDNLSTTTEKSETMEVADTFWPALRTPYGIRGIHIPLTFSITGTYGNSGSYGSGVVGSSYASISSDGGFDNYGGFGKSALAGSSYGTYPGVRVYGGSGKFGWSGWGNGKWGHYGKG